VGLPQPGARLPEGGEAFVHNDGVGAAELSVDKGGPKVAKGHLAFVTDCTEELLWVFDYWLDHSRPSRQ